MADDQKEPLEQWINEDVILDFPIPKSLQPLIEMCEEMNKTNDYGYFSIADAIDVGCKELCVKGILTEEQWDLIIERYAIV